ncbi:L,D-transpeptidase family protein [Sphingomonas sabuli]|uniref:L,D-transpeptidase family protein n=1 Tax=Sphingomonas sabuli TaxID=2764186 RepID=A0A7G9L073_9SPHN|nr:L,D-transpeptidase family protein [Sphingomonas sabuli]QNM82022.1 L,D-transpeptidase family protein [Sphingomonas sabuli]
MRLPILLLSAATLALGACNFTSNAASDASAQVDPGTDLSDRDLETRVMAALDDAPKNGLTKDLFLKGDLPSDGAEKRQALLKIAHDYASALANGKVDPSKVRDVYTLPRAKMDVSEGLKQALAQDNLREWLASLAPQTDEYRALSKAFVQLVQSTPNLEGASIPATGKVIRPGDKDPRVAVIAQNLRAQGYLQTASATTAQAGTPAEQRKPQGAQQAQPDNSQPAAQPAVFTKEMSEALKNWQSDAGLKADGVVGPDTVGQLNGGPKDRARKLAIAMERLRWLEREPPKTRIDVNTAATFLQYFREGSLADQRRVVVGQPGWETPALGSPIYALVANPDWVVPDSIVKEEISKRSPAYLKENNFVQKDGRWVQQPGPDSALGEVKFAMKNDEAIYLHDTPAKAAFQSDERHQSHGCIRVQNAVQFAQMLAQQNGIADKFSEAMANKDKESQVALPNEIPVRLLYHTAYLGGNGRVQYAPDVYGWDNDVASALGYETRQVAKPKRNSEDVGP